ncbi:LOW QUALITY PROTEIN: secreted protein, partial [Streptomyces viridochromogenes DSM 40736]
AACRAPPGRHSAACRASPPSPPWCCARTASRTPPTPPQARPRRAPPPRPTPPPGRTSCRDRTGCTTPPTRSHARATTTRSPPSSSNTPTRPNGYDCADAPGIIQDLYTGQTGTRDWDDIGYNFVVDRCGTIYEGRAGGVERAVTGAHTQGFNHRTTGIAALGTFTEGMPVPKAMVHAIAALSAWKLGLAGIDPRASVRLVSSNGLSRYAAGTTAELPALAGHSDGYMTSCPGAALHARLPEIRELAARMQGRTGDPQQDHSRRAVSSDPGALRSSPQPADRRWGS